MIYKKPEASFQSNNVLVRDEWWQAVLLFVIWAYSQYAMKDAVKSCEKEGGVATVESYVFGTIWKVSCYEK